jgi:hypothetical protein
MIEIVQAEQAEQLDSVVWACWLQITQGAEAWMLPATAPGTLAAGELQAYFDAQEADLWRVAQAKQYTVDVWERIPLKRLLKAEALVIMDEINILRQRAGLPVRTADQIVTAIKANLRQ